MLGGTGESVVHTHRKLSLRVHGRDEPEESDDSGMLEFAPYIAFVVYSLQ